MDHIIVGIDGSTGSARAIEWAAVEASRAGVVLEIVHALDIPGRSGIYADARMSSSSRSKLETLSQDLVDIAARRAAEIAPDVKIESRIQIGSPTSVLVGASQDGAAVVLGSRGVGAFERFMGSVSLRVAARAYCPVVVVPDHGAEPAIEGPIVVGVDDSQFTVAALRFALSEAQVRKSSIRAVDAYQLPMVTIPLDPSTMASHTGCGLSDRACPPIRVPVRLGNDGGSRPDVPVGELI